MDSKRPRQCGSCAWWDLIRYDPTNQTMRGLCPKLGMERNNTDPPCSLFRQAVAVISGGCFRAAPKERDDG